VQVEVGSENREAGWARHDEAVSLLLCRSRRNQREDRDDGACQPPDHPRILAPPRVRAATRTVGCASRRNRVVIAKVCEHGIHRVSGALEVDAGEPDRIRGAAVFGRSEMAG